MREMIPRGGMSMRRVSVAIALSVVMFAVSECRHRLVADPGQRSARVYQDEDVYNVTRKIQRATMGSMTKEQRGFVGLVAGIARTEGKDADDGTRVAVISQDGAGAQVELLEGPDKGCKGFVPSDNLR
jgi:hypothetical protein